MYKGLFFAIILIISFNMNFFFKKLIAKLILIISFLEKKLISNVIIKIMAEKRPLDNK